MNATFLLALFVTNSSRTSAKLVRIKIFNFHSLSLSAFLALGFSEQITFGANPSCQSANLSLNMKL